MFVKHISWWKDCIVVLFWKLWWIKNGLNECSQEDKEQLQQKLKKTEEDLTKQLNYAQQVQRAI